MAKTLAASALVLPGTSKAAATTLRARIDVSAADGGFLTMAVTNGATGPSDQCVMTVLAAHGFGYFPSEGGEGSSDWKRVTSPIGCGLVGSARTNLVHEFGPGIAYLEVEFSAHTGPNVVCEAFVTTYAYSA